MRDTKKNRIKGTIIRRKSKAIEPNFYRSTENERYLAEINEKKDYARLVYGICFLVLAVVEVLIAMFVHDEWVRPYGGDIIIIFVIYAFIRMLLPHGFVSLPIVILLFACLAEGLQYINIVEKLGLGDIEFFNVLLGTVGDVKDIICYAVGCLILIIYEIIRAVFFGKPKS
ncbi:MAG: DUF2809 domain-containing protein [Lachnospiraceae bacterium]|nr:DUF2809 domain-containing protein [Lachnospiraceae bacterium]